MKLKNRIHAVSLLVILLSMASVGGVARADLGEDTHIQETGEIRIEIDRRVYEEFARMFGLGYPPATVMMHAISTGMSINDILFIAIKSDLSRAREFYDTAESLLPALPGWACQANRTDERYTKAVDPSDLGNNPSIRQVAQLFFDENRRVMPFPDWAQGQVHMQASVSELADLVTDEQWYVAGKSEDSPRTVPNRPVFVSLYRHNSEIIVDSGFQRIRRAQEQGIEQLPVVLVYNDSMHRSISDFEGDVTVGELADEFYGEGIQVTAVPEWQVGDHHKSASVDELEEIVEIPDQEEISPERWQSIEERLRANGMELPKPLLLTLVRSGQGNAWVDDPAMLSVASSLGMEQLPVVLFYHEIDRRPCGQPSDCEQVLCDAATAAGASEEICESGNQQNQATAAAGSTGKRNRAPGGGNGVPSPVALGIDPGLYEGLSYTQNQCSS